MKVFLICATRASAADFQTRTPLGSSLARLGHDERMVVLANPSNTCGLPQVYNETLGHCDDDGIVVFLHDDVWIDDYHMIQRIVDGLQRFDVVGICGNRRRLPKQAAWCFVDTELQWDDQAYLSGAIAHGESPGGQVQYYGPSGVACELLDGVLLAAKSSVLRERSVSFDTRFDFNYYDLDFCRTARRRGLTLGTWPLCLTHQSPGKFGTAEWRSAYQTYLAKWGD